MKTFKEILRSISTKLNVIRMAKHYNIKSRCIAYCDITNYNSWNMMNMTNPNSTSIPVYAAIFENGLMVIFDKTLWSNNSNLISTISQYRFREFVSNSINAFPGYNETYDLKVPVGKFKSNKDNGSVALSYSHYTENKVKFYTDYDFSNTNENIDIRCHNIKPNIDNIVISAAIDSIEPNMFYQMTSLKHIYFDGCDRLETICESAFNGSGIESITIPKSVTEIEISAFENCKELRSVLFTLDRDHHNLKTIKSKAFLNCIKLNTISIPTTVEMIGVSAFENCKSLSYISSAYVNNGEPIKGLSVFMKAFKGSGLEYMPDFIKRMKDFDFEIFANCKCLEEIYVPANIKFVRDNAFAGCSLVSKISFGKVKDILNHKIEYIGDHAFDRKPEEMIHKTKERLHLVLPPNDIDIRTAPFDKSTTVHVPSEISEDEYSGDITKVKKALCKYNMVILDHSWLNVLNNTIETSDDQEESSEVN